MVRAVDGVSPAAVHELAVAAVVAAPQEADAGERVLRPADEVVAPQRREHLEVAAFVSRVVAERLLPARERPAVVLAADLPAAGVAAEERDVAAVADVLFEVVAHRRGPVLVVADAQHELVVLEQLRAEFEVGVDAVIERVAVLLGPAHERFFPVAELRMLRAVERDAAALNLVPAVVGVQAVAAPVRVGVVSVGRELKQDLRVLPRFASVARRRIACR